MESEKARKILRSHSGVKITINDKPGQESFAIETPDGQKLLLQDAPGHVEISDQNGNAVKLETTGITVKAAANVTVEAAGHVMVNASANVTVNASANVRVNASFVEVNAGTINVNARMTNFDGVVKCDTLISNSVISASYTPGAGNLL